MTRLLPLSLSLSLISLVPVAANAQVTFDNGSVTATTGIFTLQTSSEPNASGILNVTELITETTERVPQPISDTQLAPKGLVISVSADAVIQAVSEVLPSGDITDIVITQSGSISSRPGDHLYALGGRVTHVDGTVTEIIVSGDGVSIGPDGQSLEQFGSETISLTPGQSVSIDFFHLAENRGERLDSGVSITSSGEAAIEDIHVGSELNPDNDWNDGLGIDLANGTGTLVLTELSSETTTEERTEPLSGDRGDAYQLLPHLNGEGQPSAAGTLSVTSDGVIKLGGQLRPLNRSRPFLLGANASHGFNAGVGEYSTQAAISATQFLTRTHRDPVTAWSLQSQSSPGHAAYANSGGAVVTFVDGSQQYVELWNQTGSVSNVDLPLEPIAVHEAIYPNQETGALGVLIAAPIGLIRRDETPENFYDYGVRVGGEDTLRTDNPVIANVFDGIQRDVTRDYNDGWYVIDTSTVSVTPVNKLGVFLGAALSLAGGNAQTVRETSTLTSETTTPVSFDVSDEGMIDNIVLGDGTTVSTQTVARSVGSQFEMNDIDYELVLGTRWYFNQDTAWQKNGSYLSLEGYTGTDTGIRAGGDIVATSALRFTGDVDYRADTDTITGNVGVNLLF